MIAKSAPVERSGVAVCRCQEDVRGRNAGHGFGPLTCRPGHIGRQPDDVAEDHGGLRRTLAHHDRLGMKRIGHAFAEALVEVAAHAVAQGRCNIHNAHPYLQGVAACSMVGPLRLLPGEFFEEATRLFGLFERVRQITRVETFDDQRPAFESAGVQQGKDDTEIDLPRARRHQDVLRVTIVFHAHAADKAVHRRRVHYRAQLAVGVIVDIARIVPDAEVLVADRLDGPATLRARGIEPTVRLDADTDAPLGRIVAAFGNGLVVGVVELAVAGAAHEQVRRTAGSAVVDQLP